MQVSNLGNDRFKQIELLVGGSRPRKLLAGNDVLSGGYYGVRREYQRDSMN